MSVEDHYSEQSCYSPFFPESLDKKQTKALLKCSQIKYVAKKEKKKRNARAFFSSISTVPLTPLRTMSNFIYWFFKNRIASKHIGDQENQEKITTNNIVIIFNKMPHEKPRTAYHETPPVESP